MPGSSRSIIVTTANDVAGTRIIATTAYYTHDTEQEVLRRGFDGYVAKPFDKNLINYLQSVLS